MIRKIVSNKKKWVLGRTFKAATQESTQLGDVNYQAQNDSLPDIGQKKNSAELDKDTANEVVTTWNLLNPP